MNSLDKLIQNNRDWAENITKEDPTFFEQLSKVQTPEYLWIGCSDSRVPANQLLGLLPGEVFVHRNIANQVVSTDLNCMSVLEYSIKVLKVKHVIVCGHYGCGGVKASVDNTHHGLVDNWLYNITNIYAGNIDKFKAIENEDDRHDLLCEMNVTTQVRNVANTHIVQQAWQSGQQLAIHGWIYNLKDGLLKNLGVTVKSQDGLGEEYQIKG